MKEKEALIFEDYKHLFLSSSYFVFCSFNFLHKIVEFVCILLSYLLSSPGKILIMFVIDNFTYCNVNNYFRDGRVFSQKIALPIDADIEFRYFIAVICQSNGAKNSAKTLIIRKWETHMTPRMIRKNSMYLLKLLIIYDSFAIIHIVLQTNNCVNYK